MKAYVITTGVIFLLISFAHISRIVLEDSHLASDPFFLLMTLLSMGLSIWAAYCVKHTKV